MSIKWQFAASSSKVGRDTGAQCLEAEPPMIDELVQPISTPTSRAVWLCSLEWHMSSDLPKVIHSQQLWQGKGAMLAWMLHLSVHLSGLMALRMNAKIKLFQYCCVSQFSNFSTILSWGRVFGECPHSNKSQTGVHRALHIPPLFTATFSVKEKKQSDCL